MQVSVTLSRLRKVFRRHFIDALSPWSVQTPSTGLYQLDLGAIPKSRSGPHRGREASQTRRSVQAARNPSGTLDPG